MKCAVVDPKTGEVLNVIVADPERDPWPHGVTLVALEDSDLIDQNWEYRDGKFEPGPRVIAWLLEVRHEWDSDARTFRPNAELQAEIDAALAQEAKTKEGDA